MYIRSDIIYAKVNKVNPLYIPTMLNLRIYVLIKPTIKKSHTILARNSSIYIQLLFYTIIIQERSINDPRNYISLNSSIQP